MASGRNPVRRNPVRKRRHIRFCQENEGHISISMKIGDGCRLTFEDYVSTNKKGQKKLLDKLKNVIARAENILRKS